MLKAYIETPKKRQVTVSTIVTATNPLARFPETCVFWSGSPEENIVGSSQVETYANTDEAIEGHDRWVKSGEAIDEIIDKRKRER